MNQPYPRDRDRVVFSTATALALHFLAIIVLELFDWQARVDEAKLSAPIVVELAETVERNPGPRTEIPVERPAARQEPIPQPEPQQEVAQAAPEPVPAETPPVTRVSEPPQSEPVSQARPAPQPTVEKESAPQDIDYAALIERMTPVEEQVARSRPRIERAPAQVPKNEEQVPPSFAQGSAPRTTPPAQAATEQPAPAAAPAEPERDLGFLDQAIEQSFAQASKGASGDSRSEPTASESGGGAGAVSDIRISWDDPGNERRIEWRPLFVTPSWVGEQGLLLRLGISLGVSDAGIPSRVSITRSSGYPEIDALVEQWVRNWKFTPVRDAGTASGSFPLTIRSR